MKIFFSYPHDDNATLVDRIQRDLVARGHEVWLDKSKIKEGDEWRSRITRGILGCESVVAFLSKHAVRDPGVCLNEMAIALAEKGDDAIITVLVEPEHEVATPVSMTHIQWLRMEDWASKQNDESWYRIKLEKLIDVIEHPISASRNEELERLRLTLDPLSFNSEIRQHLPRFTGRAWLIGRYRQWLDDPKASRVFRIEGGPGLGKTAVASQLAHTTKSSVLALFLCQYNRGNSRNPLYLIQTLAYQLATRLPDYRARLLKVPSIVRPELMKDKDAASLWASLIAEPMAGVGMHGLIDRQRLAIVIDGLDEATENGENAIVRLLAEQIKSLPSWVCVVLTGRPDPEIAQRLEEFVPEVIKGEDPRNRDDLSEYIQGWLKSELAAGRLAQHQVNAAAAALLESSEGAFLYLVQAREAAQVGALDLTRPDKLPRGLNEIYLRYFERRFPDTAEDSFWSTRVKPLLALVLASPEPLPQELARELLDWKRDDGEELEAAVFRSLGSLLQRRGNSQAATLALFHNSVREWLCNPKGTYFVSTRAAMRSLTMAVWQRYCEPTNWRELRAQMRFERDEPDRRTYQWMVLPYLLPEMQRQAPEALWRLLRPQLPWHIGKKRTLGQGSIMFVKGFANYWVDKWSTRQYGAFCEPLFALADSMEPAHRLNESISLIQVHIEYQRLAKNADYTVNVAVSYLKLGHLKRAIGHRDEAREYCRKALEIVQPLANAASKNTTYDQLLDNNSRYAHLLAGIYLELGQVEGGLNQPALDYYRKSIEISSHLTKDSPEKADYAYVLCAGYVNLAGSERCLDKPLAAQDYYRRALEIGQSLFDTTPGNAEYAHALAGCYDGLGYVESDLGQPMAAQYYCRHAIEIRQRLHEASPKSADIASELSDSYRTLGNIQSALGNIHAALDSYHQAMELSKRLVASDPENTRFARDLSINYDKLAKMQLDLGNAQSALELYQQSLAISERLNAGAPENTDFAHDLRIRYDNLAMIQLKLGNTPATMELYQQSLAICKRLAASAPENTKFARDLSISYDKLAEMHLDLGNTQAAMELYQQSLAIRERLVASAPDNTEFARDLSINYDKLAKMQLDLGNTQAAMKLYQQSVAICERLTASAPENTDFARALMLAYMALGSITEQEKWRLKAHSVLTAMQLRGNITQVEEELRSELENFLTLRGKLTQAGEKPRPKLDNL